MKKILVLFLFVVITTAPVFAENLVKFRNNFYVDTDSIEEYVGDDGQKNPNRYSVWIKILNNDSDYCSRTEQIYKTKIGYIKVRAVLDLQQKTIAKRNFVIYDTNDKVIKSTERPDKSFRWFDITPGSNREKIMKIVKKTIDKRNNNFMFFLFN